MVFSADCKECWLCPLLGYSSTLAVDFPKFKVEKIHLICFPFRLSNAKEALLYKIIINEHEVDCHLHNSEAQPPYGIL